MNEPDQTLRRLFAEAPVVAPDETFVAAVTAEARRSRSRRPWLVVAWVLAVPLLSVLLAQFAPVVMQLASVGVSLLQLPEVAASAVAQGAGGLQGGLSLPALLYLSLAVAVPLLAGTMWLLARKT